MKHRRSNGCRRWVALAGLALCIAVQSRAATVTFQGKQYVVSVVPLGPNVPASNGADLVFVALAAGGGATQKLLAIPTDPTVRACFDPERQYFLRCDRTNGLINGFTTIASTFVNLDGTFISTKSDSPPLNGNISSVLSIALPTATINTSLPADIQILYAPDFLSGGNTIGYRTSETTVYELDDSSSNAVVLNTDPVPNYVATGAVAFEFDTENQTLLFVQPTLQDGNGNTLSGRLSAYTRNNPALLFDQIILDSNPAIPGYKGTASGIAYDVINGDIYILDSTQLIVFARVTPTLTSITPAKGTVAGGTNLTLNGLAFPSDSTVTIDGISVSSTVVSADEITCTTLAHAPGAVTVLINSASLTAPLSGTYTYVDLPPVCTLTAPATAGTLPFTVNFNATSSSPDSSIALRVLDFGDGNQYVFPSDFTVTTASHTYAVDGTYQATFTVTDTYGVTATASLRIIAGRGGADVTGVLILKKFKMNLVQNGGSPADDSVSMEGQVLLPNGLTPADFAVNALSLTIKGPASPGATQPIDSIPLKQKHGKFSMKAAKGLQYQSGTYLFTLNFSAVDLQGAFDPKLDPTVNGRAQLGVSLDFQTAQGRNFFFEKTGANDVVVNVKPSKKSVAISLTRP